MRPLSCSSLSKRYAGLVLMVALTACQSAPALASTPSVKSWDDAQSKGDAAFFAAEYGNAERLLKMAVVMARTYGPTDMRVAKSAGEFGHLLCVGGSFSKAQPFLEKRLTPK